MIRNMLKAMTAHPAVTPSCSVDDLSAEMAGPDKHIDVELGGFIRNVADSFKEDEMELSKDKSVCSASSAALGKMLEAPWRGLSTTLQKG